MPISKLSMYGWSWLGNTLLRPFNRLMLKSLPDESSNFFGISQVLWGNGRIFPQEKRLSRIEAVLNVSCTPQQVDLNKFFLLVIRSCFPKKSIWLQFCKRQSKASSILYWGISIFLPIAYTLSDGHVYIFHKCGFQLVLVIHCTMTQGFCQKFATTWQH